MSNGIFDYIKNINAGGPNLMRDSENDTLSEKEFLPWTANVAFSMNVDTILHANIMNLNSHLHPREVYEFYKYSVRPRNRFEKWVKYIDNADLTLVCKIYSCNRTIGASYLSLMSKENLKQLRKTQILGGKK